MFNEVTAPMPHLQGLGPGIDVAIDEVAPVDLRAPALAAAPETQVRLAERAAPQVDESDWRYGSATGVPQRKPAGSVPVPPPLLDVILDIKAPPPLPVVAPGEPRPVTMHAMPRVELAPPVREHDHGDNGAHAPLVEGIDDVMPGGISEDAPAAHSVSDHNGDTAEEAPAAQVADAAAAMRDGTSPFARNYSAARPMPEKPVPVPPPPPRPFVVEDFSGLSRLESPAAFADVTDLHATEAWREALFDAVEKGHQGGTGNPEDKARIFLDDDGWEDVRYESYDGTTASPPADRQSVSMPALVQRDLEASELAAGADDAGDADDADDVVAGGRDVLATVVDGAPFTDEEVGSPLAELVDSLDALDDGTVERAKKQLMERGLDAMPALAHSFPGRLRVDPFDPGATARTADQLGPLLEVLYALGPAGLDAAVPHLDSRYPAHRFAAVLLFALTPDPRGIDLLRARLHDQEPRIRELAAEALAPFVAHPRFEAVLSHLRERLQSPLLDARRRAVQLLGLFRDVGAVPLLMTLLELRAAELAEDARHALRAITLQDFGVRSRGWERWWTKAKKRSRVDWLIEGLSSEDREIRTIAHGELAAIAGDDFGYRPDEPRRSRQRAVAVFQTWWTEEQRPKAG